MTHILIGVHCFQVVKIDGRVIGEGEVGPVTRKLQSAYKKLTDDSGVPIPTYQKLWTIFKELWVCLRKSICVVFTLINKCMMFLAHDGLGQCNKVGRVQVKCVSSSSPISLSCLKLMVFPSSYMATDKFRIWLFLFFCNSRHLTIFRCVKILWTTKFK